MNTEPSPCAALQATVAVLRAGELLRDDIAASCIGDRSEPSSGDGPQRPSRCTRADRADRRAFLAVLDMHRLPACASGTGLGSTRHARQRAQQGTQHRVGSSQSIPRCSRLLHKWLNTLDLNCTPRARARVKRLALEHRPGATGRWRRSACGRCRRRPRGDAAPAGRRHGLQPAARAAEARSRPARRKSDAKGTATDRHRPRPAMEAGAAARRRWQHHQQRHLALCGSTPAALRQGVRRHHRQCRRGEGEKNAKTGINILAMATRGAWPPAMLLRICHCSLANDCLVLVPSYRPLAQLSPSS